MIECPGSWAMWTCKMWIIYDTCRKGGSKTKAVIRDKGGHYIMIKRLLQQEDINLVNIYISHKGAPKCINQILPIKKDCQ